MEWLGQNWFWVVVLVAFVGMHLFGHGGHGGHGGGGCGGGHRHGRDREGDDTGRPSGGGSESKPGQPPGHQH